MTALCLVEREGAYVDKALKQVLANRSLSPADKALATELAYGAVRHRRRLDYILARYSKLRLKKIACPILQILRTGLYQLLFLERVPQSAAVHEAVALAKRYGHPSSASFTNAVLRAFVRDGDVAYPAGLEGDCVFYSHPDFMAQLWSEQLGPLEAKRLMKANNQPPKTTVRVNPLRTNAAALQTQLEQAGVAVSATDVPGLLTIEKYGDMARLEAYTQGLLTPQDKGAYLAAAALDPQPGDLVLDVCAAPGGKTTQLAELAGDKAQLVAFDIHPHKIPLIEKNAARLGLSSIRAQAWDASAPHPDFLGKAHRVLADVPCSGLGVIRKKPDIKWTKTPADLQSILPLQRSILSSAGQYLRPGGRLVYSTCTITRAENQDNARWFAQTAGFVLVEERQFLPHQDGCDGFYYAVLEKKGDL